MLGADVGVTLAILLTLASTLLCVAYGWSRWNADGDAPPTGEGPPTSDRTDDSRAPEGGP